MCYFFYDVLKNCAQDYFEIQCNIFKYDIENIEFWDWERESEVEDIDLAGREVRESYSDGDGVHECSLYFCDDDLEKLQYDKKEGGYEGTRLAGNCSEQIDPEPCPGAEDNRRRSGRVYGVILSKPWFLNFYHINRNYEHN